MRLQRLSYAGLLFTIVLMGCAPAPSKPVVAVKAAPVDPEAQKRQAEYDKVSDRYYQIDQQQFKRISCTIDAPALDSMVQGIRSYLTRLLGDKVEITDTLADYKLTYTPDTGLHIDDPTVDLIVKPGTQMADPAKVSDGREKLVTGFKAMAAGMDSEINNVLHILESDKHEDFDILYVNETQDGYNVSYMDRKSKTQVTVSATADAATVKASTPDGGQVITLMHFSKMADGKLLMSDLTEDVNSAMGKTHSVMNVGYQVLGGVTFPATMDIKADMEMLQMSHQQISMDASMKSCSIE